MQSERKVRDSGWDPNEILAFWVKSRIQMNFNFRHSFKDQVAQHALHWSSQGHIEFRVTMHFFVVFNQSLYLLQSIRESVSGRQTGYWGTRISLSFRIYLCHVLRPPEGSLTSQCQTRMVDPLAVDPFREVKWWPSSFVVSTDSVHCHSRLDTFHPVSFAANCSWWSESDWHFKCLPRRSQCPD